MATINVIWNQRAPLLTTENYKVYSESNTSLSIDSYVATLTWRARGGGYGYTLIPQSGQEPQSQINHKFYICYNYYPDFYSTTTTGTISGFTVEWLGGIAYPNPKKTFVANQWQRESFIDTAQKTSWSRFYVPNLRNYSNSSVAIGSTCKVKGIAMVDLTLMFGEGKEPTSVEDFEAQCAYNGIDLTEQLEYNHNGTEREWKIPESQSLLTLRKNIMMNQPALFYLPSSNISHFETNFSAPLKKCQVNISIQQGGSGDPSPENRRPLVGVNNITITRSGKNLFDKSKASFGYITSSGGIALARNNIVSDYIPVLNSSSITASMSQIQTGGAGPQVAWFKEDKTILSRATATDAVTTRTFSPVQPKYFRVWYSGGNYSAIPSEAWWDDVDLQVEFNNNQTSFEEYKGTDFSITWNNPSEGLYCGYIDLTNGVLVSYYDCITFNGTEQWGDFPANQPSKRYILWIDTITGHNNYADNSTEKPVLSTHFKFGGTDSTTYGDFRYNPKSGGRTYFAPTDPNGEHWGSRDAFVTWVTDQYNAGTPVQALLPLLTPKQYSISPQIIKTLKGTNNIWSSAGDIELSYWKY